LTESGLLLSSVSIADCEAFSVVELYWYAAMLTFLYECEVSRDERE
jgi:hypothetical protein